MAKRKCGSVRAMKEYIRKIIRKEIPFFAGVPAFVWHMIYFYIPLLFIVLLSFFAAQDGTLNQFTVSHYLPFIAKPYFFIFIRSLVFALITAIVCLCVGYPLAYFLVFKAKKWKDFFLFLLIVPFFTNFLLHVYAWFFVLERNGFLNTFLRTCGIIDEPFHFLNTPGATLLVMFYCYLPFMVLPLYSVLEKFEHKLVEASLDLGASAWQTFMRITVPLTAPGIISGFFLVFVPAFGEFVIPGLLGGEKLLFVGTVISSSVLGAHTMADGAAYTVGVCGMLVIVSLCVVYILKKLLTRGAS